MPRCKKCGQQHYNLEKCEVVAARREGERNRAAWNLMPDITPPEGFHRFGGDQTRTVKRHGGLEVVESGLRLQTGKLTLPPAA